MSNEVTHQTAHPNLDATDSDDWDNENDDDEDVDGHRNDGSPLASSSNEADDWDDWDEEGSAETGNEQVSCELTKFVGALDSNILGFSGGIAEMEQLVDADFEVLLWAIQSFNRE